MELQEQIEVMDERLEKVEIRLETIASKADSTHSLVEEIHTIVLGTEHTRNDSILAKILQLQEEIKILKEDKTRRDTALKTYLSLALLLGGAVGAIIAGIFKLITAFATK